MRLTQVFLGPNLRQARTKDWKQDWAIKLPGQEVQPRNESAWERD